MINDPILAAHEFLGRISGLTAGRRCPRWLLIIGFTGAVIVPIAPGAMIELWPVADAVLYEDASGGSANGSGEFLLAGRTNQGSDSRRRSLIAFDFSSLPQGATVTMVTLRLQSVAVATAELSVSLHRVTSPWTAGPSDPLGNESSGVLAGAGDATWIHSSFPSLWAAPGGDFLPEVSAMATITSAAGIFEWSGAGLLADVLYWLDEPGEDFGWMLKGDESLPQTAKRFISADSAGIDSRPKLLLEYSLVPEPGVCVLLALGGFLPWILRRRPASPGHSARAR